MTDRLEHKSEGGSPANTGAPPSAFLESTPQTFGIAHLLGMQIVQAQDGVGQVRIEIDGRLMHPQQMVHGGVIFTIADTAMSMALLSMIPPGTPFGTIEAKINYLLPASSGELLAEGKIVHLGGSTAVLEASVYNLAGEQRRTIAKVLGTFYIKRQKSAENNAR
ncbi:MAG TPA: PaaI family thioesterase [Ktedonobacteraceae bacterium]|nr:PaaI family thioesterase [Ktedonobacteraceae bacterium]